MNRVLSILMCGMVMFSFTKTALAANEQIIKGDCKVTLNYALTVDGQLIDSSEGKKPLQYTNGKNQIIPGLEKALQGLHVGDEKTIVLNPKDGYGEVDPKALRVIPKSNIPSNIQLKPGMFVEMKGQDGAVFPALVVSVDKDTVTLNFNHPLAGKELTFKIKIVSIE